MSTQKEFEYKYRTDKNKIREKKQNIIIHSNSIFHIVEYLKKLKLVYWFSYFISRFLKSEIARLERLIFLLSNRSL